MDELEPQSEMQKKLLTSETVEDKPWQTHSPTIRFELQNKPSVR
jgi:hypothetical protein